MPFLGAFDWYMDYSASGAIQDEALLLGRVRRAFKGGGCAWSAAYAVETGMKPARSGGMAPKAAFDRSLAAVTASGCGGVIVFCAMDGLAGDDSFGLLRPDYSPSPVLTGAA